MFVLDKICAWLLGILDVMATGTTRVDSIICRGSELHRTVLHLRLVYASHWHFRNLACVILEWDWSTCYWNVNCRERSLLRHRCKKCLVTLTGFQMTLTLWGTSWE